MLIHLMYKSQSLNRVLYGERGLNVFIVNNCSLLIGRKLQFGKLSPRLNSFSSLACPSDPSDPIYQFFKQVQLRKLDLI